MKVVLDESAPEQIAPHLPGHDVQSVRNLHLKGTKNGKLLDAIEGAGFDRFVTCDKRMEREQNLSRRPYAILLLSTNHWPTIEPNVGRIASALNTAQAGTITKVECGKFVPRRFRNPQGIQSE